MQIKEVWNVVCTVFQKKGVYFYGREIIINVLLSAGFKLNIKGIRNASESLFDIAFFFFRVGGVTGQT